MNNGLVSYAFEDVHSASISCRWKTLGHNHVFFFFLPFKVLSQRLELERDDELVPEKNS